MNDRRKRLIKILFDSFDKNKTGFINLDEIRNSYSPKNHPDVLSEKKQNMKSWNNFWIHYNIILVF